MPIDISTEKLIEINKVPKEVERLTGSRPSLQTVYRWRQKGVAGIKLETLFVNGKSYVSLESLNRFFVQSALAKQGRISIATTAALEHAKERRRKHYDAEAQRLGLN